MLLPVFARDVPTRLQITKAEAREEELAFANEVRSAFLTGGGEMPYMTDIIRAFRAAKGAKSYLEVGSRDKGNVAWLSHTLDPKATIVEIDVERDEAQENKLRAYIKPSQTLKSITGDCLSPSVVSAAASAFQDKLVDIIFLDTQHWYEHCLSEIAVYFELLKPGGLMFVHDAFYEGEDGIKGKAWAFSALSSIYPVYCLFENEPPSRYFRRGNPTPVWGGLAILQKADR